MDIYLLEAMMNGVMLGGLLALLALGLNLIFGVIDVVWICYAELVMGGMYAIYWLHAVYAWPFLLACAIAIALVAVFGLVLHRVIIEPILGSAPINQLLATGGMLFFLQSFATLLFGTDFRNVGIRLPIIELGDIDVSFARLLAFIAAIVGAAGLYLFLARTYLGTAIRAIAQDREIMGLMGVDPRRPRGSRGVPPGTAIRRAPLHRPDLRPDHLHDLRVGRPREHVRRRDRGL